MYENDDKQKAQNKRWYLAQCKPNATHIAIRNLDNQGFASFATIADVEANARIYILLEIMGQSTTVSIDAAALTPLE